MGSTGLIQTVQMSSFVLNRHADREAEPKNYDVTKSDIDERDLLRATYDRIGNITDGVSKLNNVSI